MFLARFPSRRPCILGPSCVLRARLRTLRLDHMTVCPPRRAPRRSLRAAGAPCFTPRHSAPRVSRSMTTRISRYNRPSPMSSSFISARFALVRRVPTPALRSRLVAALPLGRARSLRGQHPSMTPPRGLHRRLLPSRVVADARRGSHHCSRATLTLAARHPIISRDHGAAVCASSTALRLPLTPRGLHQMSARRALPRCQTRSLTALGGLRALRVCRPTLAPPA